MYSRPVDPEELKWQRRDDARTLARAEEIKADKERYDGAKIGAKEILDEEKAKPSRSSLPADIPDVFRR